MYACMSYVHMYVHISICICIYVSVYIRYMSMRIHDYVYI